MKIMVVDAQEPSEPCTYVIDTEESQPPPPRHMMRMIERSSDKRFEHIMNDGADAMSGLVNTEHDEADDRAGEIFDYLEANCTASNKYRPGMAVDAYISIALC